MDACIPLSSTFSALACGVTEEGEMLVDPDPQQEDTSHALCTCVMVGNSGSVLASYTEGKFSVDKVSTETCISLPYFLDETVHRVLTWRELMYMP